MDRESTKVLFCSLTRRAGWSLTAVATVLLAGAGCDSARAQGKLEARYTVALAGIPIGEGTWVIDIGKDHYTSSASGQASGLMRAMASSGQGQSASRGSIQQGQLVPDTFAFKANTSKDAYDVRMALSGGAVKELVAQPPLPPDPERVPITEAHRRGVMDPMTAAVMPVPGTGEVVTPAACQRTLPIFDGRQRFDVALSFKRMDRVKADKGYQGPVVVCTMMYRPVSGHKPSRYAVKYMQEQRDIELWLAPIAGTRILVPFRISVPTTMGSAVLQATDFETVAQGTQPASAAPAAKLPAPARISRGS
jgi:hypothetical protein